MGTDAPAPIADLKEQAERLTLERSIAENEFALNDLQRNSGRLIEAWGDVVDPRDFYDGFGWDNSPYGQTGFYGPRYQGLPATIDDRLYGRNRPIFETEEELAGIRLRARWCSALDAVGVGVLEKLTNYVIATGYVYTAKAKRKRQVDQTILDAVQDVIDETLELNQFCNGLDRELFERSSVDGESLCAIYQVDGQAMLRTIEPEQITQPHNARELEGAFGLDSDPLSWSFGVCTPEDDVQRVLRYHVQWNQANGSDFDLYEPYMMEHVKLNVRRNVKRGLSDFHAIDRWLQRASKLLGNTADGSAVQAAIAYIRQTAPGTTSTQAAGLVQARRDSYYNTPVQGGGVREHSAIKMDGVRALTVPAGQEYKSGPLGSERAPNFMLVVAAVLRFIGQRWSMPEFLVSGDASNANYSSTMVAESPFVKATEQRQALHGASHVRILWRAVEIAYAAGRFKQFTGLDMRVLRSLVTIDAEPPRVQSRDEQKETDRNKVLADAGLMSDKTFAAREGLDLEQERADGAIKVQAAAPFGGVPAPPTLPAATAAVRESVNAAYNAWRGYP